MLKSRGALQSSRSLGDLGLEKLGRLTSALGFPEADSQRAEALFRTMTRSWSGWSAGEQPLWRNDITDDETPFEYSLAFEGPTPEFRLLVESQSMPMSEVSAWNSGLALNCELEASGAYLGAFDRIRGLFTPSAGPVGSFSLWHGAAMKPDRTLFKAYLNPQIHGPAAAPGLVEKSLRRLGRADAWQFLSERLNPKERGRDLRYFSIDLLQTDAARVKVYLARATVSQVVELVRGAKNAAPGDVAEWLRALTGSTSAFDRRPILACFCFTAVGAPPSATIHVPVRCYSSNDEESLRRVSSLLEPENAAKLEAAVLALAGRPLGARSGIITYASLQRSNEGTRATVYLAPECYAHRAKGVTRATATSGTRRIDGGKAPLTASDLEKAIEHHLEVLARHPFLRRLDSRGALTQFRSALQPMALFTLVLEDVRRLARESGSEPWLSDMARALAPSDAAKNWWQLGDLELLGIPSSLEWLFAEQRQGTREVVYRLASQAVSARSDYARLAILLVLDVVMRELFQRASAFIARASVESGHPSIAPPPSQPRALLDAAVQQQLRTFEASGAGIGEIDAALSSAFAAMSSLVDELERSLDVA